MSLRDAIEIGRRASVGINPADITLTRVTSTKSSTTGGPSSPITSVLPAQSARMVKPRPGIDPEQVTLGGKATKVDWLVLFLEADADVLSGDTFDHPVTGKPVKILGVETATSEGVAASVTALAAEVR